MAKKSSTKEKVPQKGASLSGFMATVTGNLFGNEDNKVNDDTQIEAGSELDMVETIKKEIPLEITNNQELVKESELKNNEKYFETPKKPLSENDINKYSGYSRYDGQHKHDGKITYGQKQYVNTLTAFFEVHIGNVLQYFGAGVIYPTKYSSQNAFSDIQAINSDYLTLSNGKSNTFNADNVLLKLDISNVKESDISDFKDYKLVSTAIPISRIIKLYVSNEGVKQRLLEESQLRDGGIIPEELITVGLPNELPTISVSRSMPGTVDLTNNLDRFDKILGLIAGTKNYNVLTLGKTDIYKSLSDHFFYAIQAIDPLFAKEIVISSQHSEFYKWLFANDVPKDRVLLGWLINRIYDDSNFTDKDTKAFRQLSSSSKGFIHEEKLVDRIFSLLQKSLERKSVFKEILELESQQKFALYLFAFLRIYGTKTNPELPRLDISKNPPVKFGEYSFAVLNMFFGYKLLRNTEDRLTNISEEYFKLNKRIHKPTIKFELNTKFDYLVIDKVFNYVFGEIKSELNFAQFDHLFDQKNETPSFGENFNYSSTIIHGKSYQLLIKANPLDSIMPQLMRLPNNIPLHSEIGLCCLRLRLKTNPAIFSGVLYNEVPFREMVTFSRSVFIDAVKDNRVEVEELKFRLKMAEKYKELL
ncbi:hypothetical protein [Mucilaginibacter gilvus]|uniref:Uncharacterized protein n=1 Tax=Mucilaginibacter gilvus TaxID=2305909 RepID=A0A3S3W4G2_9SPHI|nr:hypothetical protein [Mucilaginibacter gilvus]RWY48177.1 hypothetical protein EPL05_21635 [Mucilaginibacter gilvus]